MPTYSSELKNHVSTPSSTSNRLGKDAVGYTCTFQNDGIRLTYASIISFTNAECSLCYVKYISVEKKAAIESSFTAI